MTKKSVKPGDVCIIKGSVRNDGKIVTAITPYGMVQFLNKDGTESSVCMGWNVEPAIVNAWGNPQTICEERVMFPLDNPSDDEEDTVSNIRKLEYHE